MFLTTLKRTSAVLITLTTVMFGCSKEETKPTPSSDTIPLAIEAPMQLKVGEGFYDPIGYYEAMPRFSWQTNPKITITEQSAYQIQVASDINFSTPALWDSGKVNSNVTSWVKYQGKPLSSRQTVYWRVKVWDKNDTPSNWSAVESIEMGLLHNQDWQAKWIGHPDTEIAKSPTPATIATPQYLRTNFAIDKTISNARLYVSAKGLFKAYVNGQQVAPNDVMTPGWTPYKKRIETLTYDVTALLSSGNNALAATLAGGWYSGRIFDMKDTDHKVPPRFIAQLEISFTDGSKQVVVSDETWQASQQGPIRFASIYDGEKYDQALEMPGWNNTKYQTPHWPNVIAEPITADIALTPKRHAPIRITETLTVQEIVKADNNSVIFDFGQNMVGVPKLTLPVVAGETVTIRFAEALHKGEFYTQNYRSAESTDYYTASKTEVINYQPSFTYHGYRYVEISGFDKSKTPDKSWVKALVQHSDITLSSNFQSSHAKLNKLSENIVWGLRSNFYDIPLDCPQRDERLGWTGDAQVFATPSMYMADSYAFWSAWLQSMREDQGTDGKIPLYIPHVEWKIKWASSGWGDAATIIPWELYVLTGDQQILTDNYQMMLSWLDYHAAHSENFISSMNTFGDWLQPFAEAEQANRGDTNFNLISTAYYAHSTKLTLQTAKVLGKTDDIAKLTLLHQQIKQAFRANFFDDELNTTKGIATQTSYLLGLAFDLFDDNDFHTAQQKLIALLKAADNHLRTGFLGTPLLASVLQDAGRTDLVYELIFKESYPSWFYSVNNGATTTWERWNSYTIEDGFNPQGMNSLNHYAYGSIARWFYEGMLGIQPKVPGYKEIIIAPQLGKELNQAKGFYDTPQGRINVAWQVTENTFTLQVTVPNNTKADIVLPTQTDLSRITLNNKIIINTELSDLTAGEYVITATLNNI